MTAANELRADSNPASMEAIVQYLIDNPPGLVKIATASASDDATIDFTSGIDATYKTYLLVGNNVVPATDAVEALLRISIAGSFKSGASDYSWQNIFGFGVTVGGQGDTTDNAIRVHNVVGSAAGEGLSFSIMLFGPSNTALWKHIGGLSFGLDSAALRIPRVVFGTYYGGTEAVDGVQFLFDSGNVESGEFALYGLAK